MTNYGVNVFGHGHPIIEAALVKQLKTLTTLHGSFANITRAEAAKALVKRCGGQTHKVYLSNSGTEAVEAALKFAMLASGKQRIIAMQGGYHGKTFGSLSVMDNPKYRRSIDELLWQTTFVPYGDIESLDSLKVDSAAALILEPIQGESGIHIPSTGYLRAVREWCDDRGVLLIVDEIQTGVGRTGKFLAVHHEDVAPDILVLGKGLAGGIPVGATLVSKAVAEKIPKAAQTSTFGGNPLACQGIITVLELVDDELLKRVERVGNLFIQKLRSIRHKRIVEVRGKGLMIGVELTGNRNDVLKKLQNRGVLACPAGDQIVRLLPSYLINESLIDGVVNEIEFSLS
jgi:acetylornithine/LysW-gamma-L-lysine aminotransferase